MPVNNILQQVQTYNDSGLALLLNSYAFIKNSNMKFKGFNDDIPKNLGDTVTFDKPPRFNTNNSLVVSFQSAEQRVQTLTVDRPISTAYAFTAQQFIFNVRDYMEKFGKSAIAEIGNEIEQDIASVAETNTFRFYGDGVTPFSTYLQLANAIARFRNFGAASNETKGFLDDLSYPAIVNSGANQFTLERGNRESMSWEVGEFAKCEWFRSNLLKTHQAGTEGNAGSILTVVSTVTNSEGAVIQITFSGTVAASDPNSIKAFDKFQFADGVSGFRNLRFQTFIGTAISGSPVQFRANADAASTAGSQVTVNIYPPLKATAGKTGTSVSINTAIVPGMQATVLPDHKCGLIMSGDALYLAMPRLPDEDPYKTSVAFDPETGASIRMYYGSLFGQNQRGNIHDAIWGKTFVDEYGLMLAIPV